MTDAIRSLLKEHAQLSAPVEALADESDLYTAGLTSHATVNLMLALEERFGVEFPERLMRRRSFESIGAIRAAIEELHGEGAP